LSLFQKAETIIKQGFIATINHHDFKKIFEKRRPTGLKEAGFSFVPWLFELGRACFPKRIGGKENGLRGQNGG
jgi:hypothetical protein